MGGTGRDTMKPATIVIAGGYGLIGSTLARQIREAHRDVSIILAGRNPARGEALASQLGNCSAIRLDLSDASALNAVAADADIVVAALKDKSDALIQAAIAKEVAYIGIAQLAHEIAPAVIAERSRPSRRPIVLLGHWQAGMMTMAGVQAAEAFSRVDSIELTALYDPLDPIGPMTAEDSEGFAGRALLRKDRAWSAVDHVSHARQVRLSEGHETVGYPMGVLDVPSLAATTGAANVRFDLAQGQSIGTRTGGRASHDLYIDMEGILATGEPGRRRMLVSDPNGQAHLTALGALVALERVLGLDGGMAAAGGVQFPESLLSAADVVSRLRRSGVLVATE